MNTILFHMLFQPRIMDPRKVVTMDTIETVSAEDLANAERVVIDSTETHVHCMDIITKAPK